MNRTCLISLSLVLFAVAVSDPQSVLAQTRPNILVIMGDDVGWMNVASYGGDIMGVKTPKIDRIGKEGIRLTSFYVTPSCTAGREAFLTGQLLVRTGLTTVGTPGSDPADQTTAAVSCHQCSITAFRFGVECNPEFWRSQS